MKDSRVSKRYAKALFDLCLEKDLLEQVDQDMKYLELVHRESKDLRLVFKSPTISQAKKNTVLKAALGSSVQSLTMSFIQLMVKHNRETVIPAVAEAFHDLYRQHRGIISVELVSAEKVSAPLLAEIISVLKKETGSELELTEKVDPSIIGGFMLHYENKQFDASVLTQIKRLSREFNVNVYQKGY